MICVKVVTWEHPPVVYRLLVGRVGLVAGRNIGPVDLEAADAALVNMPPGTYDASDGAGYLKAILATFKGSRMRPEQVEF